MEAYNPQCRDKITYKDQEYGQAHEQLEIVQKLMNNNVPPMAALTIYGVHIEVRGLL